MKNILQLFINERFYSFYSFGITNFYFEYKKISFEKEFIIDFRSSKIFKLNIEPIFIFEFDFNISVISFDNYEKNNNVYGSQINNVHRCQMSMSQKIKEIYVYGFPISEHLKEYFRDNDRTTANFILFVLEDGKKIFFDSSYEISSITLISEEIEINDRIKEYGLILDYIIN